MHVNVTQYTCKQSKEMQVHAQTKRKLKVLKLLNLQDILLLTNGFM